MHTLVDLFTYNRWANRRVFERCRGVDSTLLETVAPGTIGTISETLKHLVGVEDAYLFMLKGQALDAGGTRESYFARDLGWFLDRGQQLGDEYIALLAHLDQSALNQPLRVPWFNFPVTAHDGLLQVLTHSAQHRAQILSVLGAQGVEVPNVDYVFMLAETQSSNMP